MSEFKTSEFKTPPREKKRCLVYLNSPNNDENSTISDVSSNLEISSSSSKKSRNSSGTGSNKSNYTQLSGDDKSNYSQHTESSHCSPKSLSSVSLRKKRNMVSIDELLSEDPPLRNTVIFLILLRVVATNHNTDNSFYSIKNFKKKIFTESKCAYSRLFLCMDINSPTGQTIYIGEGRGIGMNLWSRMASYRDNGVGGVGSILAIYSPKPITKMLANEIPIMETNSSLQLMIRKDFSDIPIDYGVTENSTRGFIANKCEVKILSAEVLSTNCSGLFCDRQRTLELLRTGKKCGCYFMRSIASNLAIVHTLKVEDDEDTLKIEDFSSFKFSLLYLTEYFPKSTQRISFDAGSSNLENLYECMDQVLDFYNKNGGFTIIGWYKRGEINDSIQNESEKVTSSVVTYHVTSIYPSKYIDSHAKETEMMKYDVLKVE